MTRLTKKDKAELHESSKKWLKENKEKLRAYIRDYMRNKRYTTKGNIKIENKNITLFFN